MYVHELLNLVYWRN